MVLRMEEESVFQEEGTLGEFRKREGAGRVMANSVLWLGGNGHTGKKREKEMGNTTGGTTVESSFFRLRNMFSILQRVGHHHKFLNMGFLWTEWI